MQKRILPIAITAIILLTIFSWNCTKLDTTDIGSDLLPAVDNVNTFDTLLTINSTQGFFDDSTAIGKSDDYALGEITNDPLFGKTNANIYMQLKPPFYPYYFGNAGDTLIALDSVVLCLKYKGFWGDSMQQIHLEVREVVDNTFRDSVLKENKTAYKPAIGNILGSADIDVKTLGNYIKFTNRRDSVKNQICIKISASAWAALLFNRDSIKANTSNNAFYTDSAYRFFYNGIAVIASGGNGLLYASLSDTATKIEIHYKRKNHGVTDSVYTSFRFNPINQPISSNSLVSNSSNYILRTRSGYPVNNPAPGDHYLQTSPGTFVSLNIPGLAGLSNRIIHRAEIIVEQVPTNAITDEIFSAPNFLYLDLKDTGANNNYKPIYYDLNTSEFYDPDFKSAIPYFVNSIDFLYFGGYRRGKTDQFGNQIKYYTFNISRYVQHIVTNRIPAYGMRLYAPFNINYLQYSNAYIPFGNNIAFGRVRIGSGSNPNYRLRLRIVYSKL